MPLAVLGGSFDPVHCGHVAMARHVLDCGLAQKVLVIPAYHSPFKSANQASAFHRLKMVHLAFSKDPNIEIDDREIRRQGPSFMVETLEELQQEHPKQEFRLIIGADNVPDFLKWHRATDILSLCKILVLGRHGYALNPEEKYKKSFILTPDFDQRVSSTEIRVILASRQPTGGLLPASVAQHIQDHGLYR